jgi:hypothetical protein
VRAALVAAFANYLNVYTADTINADRSGCCWRKINDSAPNKRTAIVDGYYSRSARFRYAIKTPKLSFIGSILFFRFKSPYSPARLTPLSKSEFGADSFQS